MSYIKKTEQLLGSLLMTFRLDTINHVLDGAFVIEINLLLDLFFLQFAHNASHSGCSQGRLDRQLLKAFSKRSSSDTNKKISPSSTFWNALPLVATLFPHMVDTQPFFTAWLINFRTIAGLLQALNARSLLE